MLENRLQKAKISTPGSNYFKQFPLDGVETKEALKLVVKLMSADEDLIKILEERSSSASSFSSSGSKRSFDAGYPALEASSSMESTDREPHIDAFGNEIGLSGSHITSSSSVSAPARPNSKVFEQPPQPGSSSPQRNRSRSPAGDKRTSSGQIYEVD